MTELTPLNGLPMTILEVMLKDCLAQRPDVADHILTSEELTDYIRWMTKSYGRPSNISISDIPMQPTRFPHIRNCGSNAV